MRVFLDGKMIGTGDTLSEALALAARSAGDRLVVEAKADGQQVPAADLEHPPEQASYASELAVTSVESSQLVASALTDAAEALTDLGAEQSAVAELLQVGETQEAMSRLGGLVGVWQQVDQTMLLAQQAMGDRLPIDAFSTEAGELTSQLGAMRDALEAGDLTTVADLLAYDMDGLPDRWSILLREVAEQIGMLCTTQAG